MNLSVTVFPDPSSPGFNSTRTPFLRSLFNSRVLSLDEAGELTRLQRVWMAEASTSADSQEETYDIILIAIVAGGAALYTLWRVCLWAYKAHRARMRWRRIRLAGSTRSALRTVSSAVKARRQKAAEAAAAAKRASARWGGHEGANDGGVGLGTIVVALKRLTDLVETQGRETAQLRRRLSARDIVVEGEDAALPPMVRAWSGLEPVTDDGMSDDGGAADQGADDVRLAAPTTTQ